jgi:FMN reductase
MTPPDAGPASRHLVVVSAGVSQPSSSRLLANRLSAATEAGLREAGLEPATRVIEVRDHAADLVNNVLTFFPSEDLGEAIEAVTGADGLIAVTPIFTASYSGLFKLFFDVLERGSLTGMPVLIGATGGTARHSLALDHAVRPLFAYLSALVLPTGVFAAPEDWGQGDTPEEPDLADRIERAGRELATAMASAPRRVSGDGLAPPVGFEAMIRAADDGRPGGRRG